MRADALASSSRVVMPAPTTAVVFGLGFSTLMILLVTPVWLVAPYRIGRWAKRIWTGRKANRVETLYTSADDTAANDADAKKQVLPAAE